MAEDKLSAEDLITRVAKPEQCLDIYTMLADKVGEEQALGVLFDWQQT